MADEQHRLVVKIEDGNTLWRIICPDDGKACGPASCCGQCGRSVGDDEIAPCYDCPSVEPGTQESCWVQSWVGTAMAEEVIYGTVEIAVPVHCQWTGDGLECHIAGEVEPLPASA